MNKKIVAFMIHFKLHKIVICGIFAIAISFVAKAQNNTPKIPTMMLANNQPQGVGQGIFPGRVVWAFDPNAITWDGNHGEWYEDQFNNQTDCNQLLKNTLLQLTNTTTEKQAWDAIFIHFNNTKNKTNTGYKQGEKIAIKINQNNTESHANSSEINASPQMVWALLNSLINQANVAQEDITITDPSRFITNNIFDKCSRSFPKVRFVDHIGGNGRIQATYLKNIIKYSKDNGKLATGISADFVAAKYVINMALLKGHIGQGVTLCAKNWYGATNISNDWRKNFHNNFNQNYDGTPKYITFVDFVGHPHFGGKTILYLIDALYGTKKLNGKPIDRWKMPPFEDAFTSSLFASQDAIAIDAVATDFLATEFPNAPDMDCADMYMVEAATIPNTPSKTIYAPKGIPLQKSLGTVEHWNNPTDKKYSRNLGKNIGIELIQIKNTKR